MTSVQGKAARIVWCLLWGAGVIAGSYMATVYAYTSGTVTAEKVTWPAGARLQFAGDRPTMVIGLHPRCACSRATLGELSRLLAHSTAPVRIEILMFHPKGSAESWVETDLTAQARSIPGAALHLDQDGAEAKRFGLSTSGHTVVYGTNGELLFSGGITRARGHAGDNDGQAALASLLSNGRLTTKRTPIFGCAIRDQG